MEWRNFHRECNRFTISPRIAKILVALESGDCEACARAVRAVSCCLFTCGNKSRKKCLIRNNLRIKADILEIIYEKSFWEFVGSSKLKTGSKLIFYSWYFMILKVHHFWSVFAYPSFSFFRFFRAVSFARICIDFCVSTGVNSISLNRQALNMIT